MDAAKFTTEVDEGNRFEFGENWRRFLQHVTSERITEAERSLTAMLGSIQGLTFIDVGCGSGLFSLAAVRLGAKRVHSLDFDPSSVACARALKRRYCTDLSSWTIEEGSAVDVEYLKTLGEWDVVYSWGVLHHTGNLWAALEAVSLLVAPSGRLMISIYDDQRNSFLWARVKKFYNRGVLQRWLVCALFIPYFAARSAVGDILIRHINPIQGYSAYARNRGMSRFHDWIDWLGGYPYEVARPENIFDFYSTRGYVLKRLTTSHGSNGCNQFVFERS